MKTDEIRRSVCRILYSTRWAKKNFKKKFCVGCSWSPNLKISKSHNLPPSGARELKIPPFDSQSKTTSNCSLRFFSKKIALPTLFSFYQYYFTFFNRVSRKQITITQGQLAILTTDFSFFSKNATVFRSTSVVIIPNMSIIKSVFLKFKVIVNR